MISLKDVILIYPGPKGEPEKTYIALNNISFSVDKGDIVAIVGSTGAGKTTLLKVIEGNLEPDAGIVLINENSLYKMTHEVRKNYLESIIYMIHQTMYDNLFYELSVEENLVLDQFIEYPLIKDRIEKILAELEILHLKKLLVGNLSGGEKQLVCFAKALLNNSELLILDEPTSALDVRNKHIIMNKIIDICKKKSLTVIFATHDSEIASYANKIFGIYNSRFDRMFTKNNDDRSDSIEQLMKGFYSELPLGDYGEIILPQKAIIDLKIKKKVLITIEKGRIILEPYPTRFSDNENDS